MRALAIKSVPFIIISGHIPVADRSTVATETMIRMLARGIAIRLVSRKYCGKDPNRSQTSGPVNS